jgi:hypothetical protein
MKIEIIDSILEIVAYLIILVQVMDSIQLALKMSLVKLRYS